MRDGNEVETLTRQIVEWHVESVPYDGNSVTGDHGDVRDDDGRTFIFAIDALGHGRAAAQVADVARSCLGNITPGRRLESVFEICHERLRNTRGIAMCLAVIEAEENTLTWLSVGNIQAVRIQLDGNGMPQFESLIMRGGVVGDRLPELRASTTGLKPGDMLVLATDGIGYGWYGEYRPDIDAAALARALRERHCHGRDDALVLVARYMGAEKGASP